MQELQKQLKNLQKQIDSAVDAIGLSGLVKEYEKLQKTIQSPDFWNNSNDPKDTMKRTSDLEKRIELWKNIETACDELLELVAFGDASMEDDLQKQYLQLKKDFEVHKTELQFSGAYDDNNVIMDIYAGAGGTDAQDWASMLLRMYTRWAEAHGFDVKLITTTPGEEAGIKSATVEIDGPFAFGLLQGEHGVHRLVRLSPYNADSLRQTSFAKVAIMPKIDEPEAVVLDEKNLKIDVYRAGGHGGQSVNTTDSAVRVTHIPTGITVSIQNERSQLQNKETALTILRSRLVQMTIEQHQEKIDELKGPNQSAEWGNQIRSYVMHPYKQVKDLRTKQESTDIQKVLDGDLDLFINAYLESNIGKN